MFMLNNLILHRQILTQTSPLALNKKKKLPLGNDENMIRLAEKSMSLSQWGKKRINDRLDAVFITFDIPLNYHLRGYV